MDQESGMEVREGHVELAQIKDVDFQDDRLVFNVDLTDDLVEAVSAGLGKFYQGRQWYFADFFLKLKESGYDWADHIPWDASGEPIISLSRAQTWVSVGEKFPHQSRIYKNLTYSHYEAVRSIPDTGAHDILKSADTAKISVHDLEQIVKGMKDKPEKVTKPKILVCKHCSRPAFEDIPCEGCMHDVAEVRIQALREVLEAIRDNDINDVGQALRFTVDVAIKALEGI